MENTIQHIFLPVRVKEELPPTSGYYFSLKNRHYFDKDNPVHKWYSDETRQYATFPKVWLKSCNAKIQLF